MERLKLQVQTRKETGKKVHRLRKRELIPAVLYGHGVKSESLAVGVKSFKNLVKEAGDSGIVDLVIDGKGTKSALIKDTQKDPLTEEFLHVDFYLVKMTEKMRADVGLKYVGTSKAVKDGGGILVKNFDEIEVECLPGDLPKEIEVDISGLNTFEDMIRVKDLPVPAEVKVLIEEEEVVTTVTPPRSEEELEDLDKEVEEKVEDVEGVEKKEEADEVEGDGDDDKDSKADKPEASHGDDKGGEQGQNNKDQKETPKKDKK